jgi:hypothetical protein
MTNFCDFGFGDPQTWGGSKTYYEQAEELGESLNYCEDCSEEIPKQFDLCEECAAMRWEEKQAIKKPLNNKLSKRLKWFFYF